MVFSVLVTTARELSTGGGKKVAKFGTINKKPAARGATIHVNECQELYLTDDVLVIDRVECASIVIRKPTPLCFAGFFCTGTTNDRSQPG